MNLAPVKSCSKNGSLPFVFEYASHSQKVNQIANDSQSCILDLCFYSIKVSYLTLVVICRACVKGNKITIKFIFINYLSYLCCFH